MPLLHEMTQHSKCFSFFPPLKRALKPTRIFCLWCRWLLPIITHGLAPVLNQWREKTEKMLLSSSLLIKGDMFWRDYKPLTHKLANQKPNMQMKGLLRGPVSQPFHAGESLYSGLRKPVGFISMGSRGALDPDSSMLLKNGLLRDS